jgi:hypothetical protein
MSNVIKAFVFNKTAHYRHNQCVFNTCKAQIGISLVGSSEVHPDIKFAIIAEFDKLYDHLYDDTDVFANKVFNSFMSIKSDFINDNEEFSKLIYSIDRLVQTFKLWSFQ